MNMTGMLCVDKFIDCRQIFAYTIIDRSKKALLQDETVMEDKECQKKIHEYLICGEILKSRRRGRGGKL